MTRHPWLSRLALQGAAALAGTVLLAISPPDRLGAQPVPKPDIRGVWITANDMPMIRDRSRMQSAVSQLAALNFNTIYAVVWNGGHAYYPSIVTEQRGIQTFSYRGLQGQDILTELIAEAHGRNIVVIPWFEFGFMAPVDSELARRHPDWLTQKRDGGRTSISAAGEVAWLNPFRPEVQQLILDLVLEVAGQYDGDGIQFDDHMSLPREFGYDPFTTALYKRETGKLPPNNSEEPNWVRWRADKITIFMGQLRKALQARKPGSIVSISPNYYDFAYKLQLQDWLDWVRRGIADEVVIQIYRPDLESFQPQLFKAEVREIQQKIPVAMGIMSGQRNRPAPMNLIQAQARATQKQGMGVAFFYLESLWNLSSEPIASRLAGLQELFPTAAPRQRPPTRMTQSMGANKSIDPQLSVGAPMTPPPPLPVLHP